MASIRKRTLPSGKVVWQCDYKDQHGKRRSRQFDRKKDADGFMVTARGEVAKGTHVAANASATIAVAADLWLTQLEQEGLEESTIRQYRQHVDLHIKPLIGSLKMPELTTPVVQQFADDLLGARKDIPKRSRAMVRKVRTTLSTMVGWAQRRGLIAVNPTEAVAVPTRRGEDTEVTIPTRAQIRAMVEAAAGYWRPFNLTAIFTGLRASELRGLAWKHVDLKAGMVSVRQRADFRGALGPPKSAAGRREIPLPPIVINALREHKLSCPKSEAGLVFPTRNGRVLMHTNLVEQAFKPMMKAAGLMMPNEISRGGESVPLFTFHALRHAAASLFIDENMTPKRVQKLMGHSSIKVTYDTYGHLFPDTEDSTETMARIQARLLDSA